MIQNEEPRERVIHSAMEGQGINLTEKVSGSQFAMTNQNAMEIVIESIEQSALYEKPIE
jgi:hypothetical protein